MAIPQKELENLALDRFTKDLASCQVCQDILKAYEHPKTEEYTGILGRVADVLPLRNACGNHTPFMEEGLAEYEQLRLKEGLEPRDLKRLEDARNIKITKFRGQSQLDFIIVDDIGEIPFTRSKTLVYDPNRPNHAGDARIVDETQIDIDFVKGWKEACQRDHAGCHTQRSPERGGPARPLLLIDTHRHCIVPAGSADFVALSYCWGVPAPGRHWFRNERAILPQLQTPGALAPGSALGGALPATIRDAVELTRRLGERHLWVDSLCIVQDDAAMKDVELPKMSQIYAAARLTLVAASGAHADAGIAGFAFTAPRRVDQRAVAVAGDTLVDPVHYTRQGSTAYSAVAYYTRGWTFQEYAFGRRRLIFEGGSARWECREASWCEDMKPGSGLEFGGRQWDLEALPDPGVEDLYQVINQYNTRDLGRKEDAFPAFCGFQRVLSRSYRHGFINGMPILFFDIAMAWLPTSDVFERRRAELSQYDPPSWSWLGWRGTVDICFSGDVVLDNSKYTPLHVTKLVDWYSMTGFEGAKTPILESAQLSDEDFSLSKEPSLLYCKTQSAELDLAEPLFKEADDVDMYGPWYHLRDSNGKWCGILRLNVQQDAEELENKTIEVVAISKGFAPEKEPEHELYGLTEWHAEERPKGKETYNYYNVLWIERRGRASYRRAIGRIPEEIWEKLNIRDIDLILA